MAPPFNPEMLAASLAELIPAYPETALCIALSGGIDSIVLLHAARLLASREAAIRLRAIHVDHGLQSDSGRWAGACRKQCEALGVALHVVELRLEVPKGESVEAEARSARYEAMAAALEPGECLLTAHHADDQLETVLLQLFRGAGVAGLAAMPGAADLGKGRHLRPLLSIERAQIEAYASHAHLQWVDDPMNRQSRYDRSYLRHEVLPAIRERWPAVARTVGRSAGHFARAQKLLEALAEVDGAGLVDEAGRLEIAGLVALPRERQVNAIRWWIARQGLGMPSTARLGAILRDVVPARDDAQPVVAWPTGEVRRYRGCLYAMPPLGPPPPQGWRQPIRIGETVELPGGLGKVSLEQAPGDGLALTALAEPAMLGFRAGGERLRPAGRRDQHTLAHLFQEAGVAPWLRGRWPILWCGDRLVAVPGLWTAAEAAAAAGAAALQVNWVASAAGY